MINKTAIQRFFGSLQTRMGAAGGIWAQLGRDKDSQSLRVVGSVSMGARDRVCVLEVGDSWIVVGSGTNGLTTLAQLHKGGQPLTERVPVPAAGVVLSERPQALAPVAVASLVSDALRSVPSTEASGSAAESAAAPEVAVQSIASAEQASAQEVTLDGDGFPDPAQAVTVASREALAVSDQIVAAAATLNRLSSVVESPEEEGVSVQLGASALRQETAAEAVAASPADTRPAGNRSFMAVYKEVKTS